MPSGQQKARSRHVIAGKIIGGYLIGKLKQPDTLLAELEVVPEAKRTGKPFAWKARSAVYGPLRRACMRAEVEYLPPHQQGRHTYATWMRTYGGMDLVGLKEAGG